MRATSFFKDNSIEYKYIEQLKKELININKLAKHKLNEEKFILIDGSFMPDKLLFGNVLRNELMEANPDNKYNYDLVRNFGLTSEYKNGAYLVNSVDTSNVNIYIDDNEKIGCCWFDFVFTMRTPSSDCRRKFISDIISEHEDLIDDKTKLVDKLTSATDTLHFIPIKQIITNVLSYAVVNDMKADYDMFVDYVSEFKSNHGIANYWS